MQRCRWPCLTLVVCVVGLADPVSGRTWPLRWGGDAEGGAPVRRGRPGTRRASSASSGDRAASWRTVWVGRPRFVQVGFTSLEASVARGDFDIGLSGIEDTPARRARLAVTFRTTNFAKSSPSGSRTAPVPDSRGPARPPRRNARGDAGFRHAARRRRADDGRRRRSPTKTMCIRIATWRSGGSSGAAGSGARRAWRSPQPVADQRQRSRSRSVTTSASSLRETRHCAESDRRDAARRDARRAAWRRISGDGACGTTIRRRCTRDSRNRKGLAAGRGAPLASGQSGTLDAQVPHRNRMAGRGATIRAGDVPRDGHYAWCLSCLSMASRWLIGSADRRRPGVWRVLPFAGGADRVGRAHPRNAAAAAAIRHLLRVRAVVELPASSRRIIGLAFNYAAYESEIYRGALLAVPAGQLEAAQTLGFSERADAAAHARSAGISPGACRR